ncbi:MAG: GNAT family N-acetyltransferase [Anaerolineaceae bacterium]|nr:GNAT family N-acetyltransferase [Anaerolineaceae bacterium]
MTITLKEVRTKKQLKQFVKFPLRLYRGNPYYVPSMFSGELTTLDREKNPAFEYCEARYWLAYEGRRVVGRVAAIINPRYNEKWDRPYMRFAWLDFIDDPAVSAILIGAVEDWAREKGFEAVHGPIGFTALDREGQLVEGFEELATMATQYNYAYYNDHLDHLGYQKEVDWIEFELRMPEELDERIAKASGIVLKRNHLHLLINPSKQEIAKYADQLFSLINSEYSELYTNAPLSEAEVRHYTNEYLGIVNPDYIPIVLDENDDMVGFGLTVPSLSRALQKNKGRLFPFGWWPILRAMKKNDRADLYLIAVKKQYRGLGVNIAMMNQVWQTFKAQGIQKIETNPEFEDNLAVQSLWKTFEKRQHKRRRVFIKHLGK